MSETYISKSTAIAARLLGSEMMIMSAADSTFFTLDEVATFIWQAADGKTSLTDIARRISDQYDVDEKQARADAEEFATELSQRGILTLSETPASDTPDSHTP